MKSLLVAALFVVACNEDRSNLYQQHEPPTLVTETDSTRTCIDPKGKFLYSYQEITGNCGKIQSYTLYADGLLGRSHFSDPLSGKVCDIIYTSSQDHCTVSAKGSCSLTKNGQTLHNDTNLHMVLSWDGRAVTGTRTESWKNSSGNLMCQSTYKATMTFISTQ